MESYAWEKKPGKPLPTLSEVQAEYNLKLREQSTQGMNITNGLGGYADPGHTYIYSNNIISKINSAGKTVATYDHTDNVWKWVEGNKALSSRLGGIFDTAIASNTQTTTAATTDKPTATIASTTTSAPVTSTSRVISVQFSSASDVSLPVIGNTLAIVKRSNVAAGAVREIVDGLVDALDDTAGVTIQDTADVYNAITKLSPVNVRKADFEYARKWNIPSTHVGHWVLKDDREMVPLLGIINSMYLDDEGISLKDDLFNLINNKLSSAQREHPDFKKNVAAIKKVLPLIK